ncbi:hypothetical protein DQ04_06391030 [Trypanosoma grayi]|uniref:hypothetical protein n=1 Tax=Trypanosoma grayi TaxID=71804 RepID=UPI0004F3F05A|nr:hypothetical protein DQ04_06391030 [Trypanosoma grayi]KEG08820.1 hypothetical protein DQ04_06391030 [Trypanosoma grayi]
MPMMPQRGAVDDEIAAIRRELVSLKEQMETGSLTSSVASLDNGDGQAVDEDDDDVDDNTTVLQRSLEQLVTRLTQERERRLRLENEVHALRVSSTRSTAEASQALQVKQQELKRLTQERRELQEWLQRGVNECRRVADEALRLKEELNERTQRCDALEATKAELQNKVDAVQQQLADTQLQLERARDRDQLLDARLKENALTPQELEEIRQKRLKDYEALTAEVESRRHRIDTLKDAEMCVQLLTERLQLLQLHVARLSQAVRKGCVQEVSPNDLFQRENVAEPSRPLEELVVRVKGVLQSLSSALQQLQVDVAKFVAEQRCLHEEQAATHREQLEATHMEKQTALHMYETEREELLGTIAQLRAETLRLLTRCAAYDAEEADRQEARIGEVEALMASNKQLAIENDELREQNVALRAKLKRLKINWRKVHDSQLRFQGLQAEVEMIAQTNEKVQKENENLKLLIETRFGTSPPQHEQQSFNKKTTTAGSLARPSVSTILADGNSRRRDTSRGQSVVRRDPSRRSNERELFREWKRTVISDYLE